MCASMNMSLLSIDSIAELFCLLKLIPAGTSFISQITRTYFIMMMKRVSNASDKRANTFWTSGSNEGENCEAQSVYASCSLGKKLPPGLLKGFLQPAVAASAERCIVLNATGTDNSSALSHRNCSTAALPFMCEPTCLEPTCPSNCSKNVRSQ
jgi:hypothetical protein